MKYCQFTNVIIRWCVGVMRIKYGMIFVIDGNIFLCWIVYKVKDKYVFGFLEAGR